MALPLRIIFNHSVSFRTLPQGWKCVKVTPINNDGSALKCPKYRPISVLPICHKVLEKILHQLYSHLNDKQIICSNQSGFRPSHSTQTALIDVKLPITCHRPYSQKGIKGLVHRGHFHQLQKGAWHRRHPTFAHAKILKKLKPLSIMT